MFILFFRAISEYYVANWQTYVSGVYNYGKIDCTENDLGIYVTIILTAIFGQTQILAFHQGKRYFLI